MSGNGILVSQNPERNNKQNPNNVEAAEIDLQQPHGRTDRIRALITKTEIQGIPNFGNTSAMNAIIQFLLCIPGYESLLYQRYDELETNNNNYRSDASIKGLCLSLMDVLCFMRGGCERVKIGNEK